MASFSNIDKSLDQIIKENKKKIRLESNRSRANKRQIIRMSKKAMKKPNNNAAPTGRTNTVGGPKKNMKTAAVVKGKMAGGKKLSLRKRLALRRQRNMKLNQKAGAPPVSKPRTPRKQRQLPIQNFTQGGVTRMKRNQTLTYQQTGKQPGSKQQQIKRQQQNRRKQNRQNQMNAQRGLLLNSPSRKQNLFIQKPKQSPGGGQKKLNRALQRKQRKALANPTPQKQNAQKWNVNQRQKGMRAGGSMSELKISVHNNVKGLKPTLNERFSFIGNKTGRTITFS